MDASDDLAGTAGSDLAVPTPGWLDRLRTAVIAAGSAVPVVGSPAAVFVAEVWRSTFGRRIGEFLDDVVDRLGALEHVVDNLDERLVDEVVVSAALDAAVAAGRSGDRDKIAYLADAVANVVADESWSATGDLTLSLMSIVADLTATQIRLLDLLADPRAWQVRSGRTISGERDESGRYPARFALAAALQVDVDALVPALAGLEARRLLNTEGLAEPEASFATADDILEEGTSALGNMVLRFVTPPRARADGAAE